MKNCKVVVLVLFCFFSISQAISKSDAEKIINNERNEYTSKSSPLRSDRNSAWEFIEDREGSLPYKVCSKPRDFKITNLAMKLHYKFVEKNHVWEWDQWDCQFHVVKIDYEITCLNNLSYRGVEYILSPTKMENNANEVFTNDRGERMADEAYNWIDNLTLNDYINTDGSITKDARYNSVWPHYSNLLNDTSYTFLAPRNYAIHDALAPWEPVLHGPFGKYEGAPQQGLDLLCALSPCCDNAFALAQYGGKNAVLKLSEIVSRGKLSERSLEVVGDFDLAPQYISDGIQAFSISANGETVLAAKYEPGKGSSITLNYGTEQIELLLLGPEFATQPSMARKGDSIFVSFVNYSGKNFRKDYYLPELHQNITATVAVPVGSAMSRVIIGSAIASDPETQKPAVPPPGHRLAPVTLAVLHREARGEYESNTSRPRFLVYNATEDTLEFSKVAYYFTADPARVPKVVVDYPYIPVSVENLGGDKWRFVLDVGNQKITPKAFYPSVDGWQIRIHYSDWYEYKHLDDWSADYSLGIVKANRKIVIYDKNGKIIWGNEAPGFESEDNGIIPTPKGTIAWKDDSPWETNAFKPRVTVKNTGSVALSDYHAQLWFRVPQGRILSIPSPDDWYTPESQASAKNVGGKVWMLDMHFDKHLLYSGDSVSEGNIGLHLADWSKFDKTVCGIALKDKDGNILFGKEPSVAECESYDGPNLLLPLYSRKQ